MPLVTVSVSVPEASVPELLRFAARLCESAETEGEYATDANGSRARWGWGRRAVEDAYVGGVSEVWRPFLEYLAERPDEWVPWQDLLDHIDRTPQEAAGMLGAAERRCAQRPPYEKRWNGDVREFRMPARVAEMVHELAADAP